MPDPLTEFSIGVTAELLVGESTGNRRMHPLIDIGANLTHDSYDRDRDAVLERAFAAGVTRLIITGATRAGSEHAAELASSRPGVLYATAGIHPHHATEFDTAAASELARLAQTPAVVAVGECGLDYFRNFSPVAAQREAFAGQLEIAASAAKPVFLHQRDAHDDFVAILSEQLGTLHGGVAHCFTGERREMEEYLEMGLYIGITGWVCDERRGRDLAAIVDRIPVLPHIRQRVAALMQRDADEVAAAATANSVALFGLS